jgi:hypothetical protein
LHQSDIQYREEKLCFSNSEIEMSAPAAKTINRSRSSFFAGRIASINLVADTFPRPLDYKR